MDVFERGGGERGGEGKEIFVARWGKEIKIKMKMKMKMKSVVDIIKTYTYIYTYIHTD